MKVKYGVRTFGICGIFFVLFLGLLLLTSRCPEIFAAEAEDALAQIWHTRIEDLAVLKSETEALQKDAKSLAAPLASALVDMRADFTRLSGLFRVSRGHPMEQLTVLQQMHGIRNALAKQIAPLENIAATIDRQLEKADGMRKDFDTLSGSTAKDRLSSEDSQAMAVYAEELRTARAAGAVAAKRVRAILGPAEAALERMNAVIADVQGGLASTWEDYYQTPFATSLQALAETPKLLADWSLSLNTRLRFAYPQQPEDWRHAALKFTVYAALAALLGFFGWRAALRQPGQWRAAWQGIMTKALTPAGLGVALIAASPNRSGGIYFAFVLPGVLLLIAGVASMSWRLRVASVPSLEGKPSPLTRMYPPAAIGVFMLYSDLPTRILGIVWGLAMIVFLIMVFFLNRKLKSQGGLPFLERLAYACAFLFGLASLFVSIAGYARLAILLFMALFALVNTIILGSALTGVFSLQSDRFFSRKDRPVRNAISHAAAVPAAWTLSLVCTLPWFWAVPGAHYIFRQFLTTGYTVGEASFDFAKIIIIVLAFFLFRSFITLGRTFLEHLPDRIPDIEKGVIPPLRTLLTYSLWAVFGLLVLGLLGVNFTSLTVVAGGLSVGIGFGLQNIFNNLISGLMLIFGRTLLVGDYVETGGVSGTVKAVNIRSTVLETSERALVYVPNSTIMAGQLINWTRNSRMVRRSLNVRVRSGTDAELVKRLLLETAAEQKHVLKNPGPAVILTSLGPHYLGFTLNVFVDFDDAVSVLSKLRFDVGKTFAEHNVFPVSNGQSV